MLLFLPLLVVLLMLVRASTIQWTRDEPFAGVLAAVTTAVTKLRCCAGIKVSLVQMGVMIAMVRRRGFGGRREFDGRDITASIVVSVYVHDPLGGTVWRIFAEPQIAVSVAVVLARFDRWFVKPLVLLVCGAIGLVSIGGLRILLVRAVQGVRSPW